MVSVLEDYYCPDTEDNAFSAPAMIKKEAEKAERYSKAGVNEGGLGRNDA